MTCEQAAGWIGVSLRTFHNKLNRTGASQFGVDEAYTILQKLGMKPGKITEVFPQWGDWN